MYSLRNALLLSTAILRMPDGLGSTSNSKLKCPDWFPQALWSEQTEATQSGILKAGKDHELVVQMLADFDAKRGVEDDDDNDETKGDKPEDKSEPTSEANMIDVSIAEPIKAEAIDAAKDLDKEMLADLTASAMSEQKAKLVSARAAYRWMFSATAVRNDNEIGRVLSWPKPGSSKKKPDASKPDHVDRFSYAKDGVNINTTFYGEMFDATDAGKEHAALVADIKLAMPGEGRKITSTNKKYIDQADGALDGKASLNSEIKTIEQRRTRQIGWLREAVMVVRVMEDINKRMPACRASFEIDGADGKSYVAHKSAPIKVYGVKKEGDTQVAVGLKNYTAKTFIRFNVDAALAAGGTITALIATIKKSTKGRAKRGTKVEVAAISTGDTGTFEAMAAEVLTFLQDNANMRMVINGLQSDKVDLHYVATLYNLQTALDSLLSKAGTKTIDAAMKLVDTERASKLQAA